MLGNMNYSLISIIRQIFSPVATLNVQSASTSSGNKDAIIAGSAVGGAALIIALLTLVFCIRRRQRRERNRHRYLPTLRSMPLAGEDDFDLGASRPTRGMMGFFGSFIGNGNERYADAATRSQNLPASSATATGVGAGAGAGAGEMQELNDEAPPRILRPVASKTGSYFQEAVWPPPGEGSRLSDPLMAASHVDLTNIVDEVMGQTIGEDPFNPEMSMSGSRGSLPPPSRLRGGAAGESASLLSSVDYGSPIAPRAGHESRQSMSSIATAESLVSPVRQHDRDWSLDSQSGLLAHVDGVAAAVGAVGGSPHSARRLSRDGAPWVPAAAHGRPMNGSSVAASPLRGVSALSISTAPPSAYLPSGSTSAKAREATEERRRSRLSISNPDPATDDLSAPPPLPTAGNQHIPESDSPSSLYSPSNVFHPPPSLGGKRSLAPSFSVSTSSTQRERLRRGTGEESMLGTPLADGSELDPVEHRFASLPLRHVPSHGRLIEVEDELELGTLGVDEAPLVDVSEMRVRDEIPPRYDMIRRDTQELVPTAASASQIQNTSADTTTSRPTSTDVGTAL